MTNSAVRDTIDHDYQLLVHGLQEHNVFLIQQSLPNVQHHIQLLDTLLPHCNTADEESTLSQMRNFLQQLVDHSFKVQNEHLNGSSSADENGSVSLTCELDMELVLHLRRSGLPWSKIGSIFSLSRQSIYNFRNSNNIEEPNVNLEDPALEAMLPNIMRQFPAAGAVTIRGMLLANGFKINVNRIKTIMKRIDPVAVHMRKRRKIRRRVYSVKGPNYLWHMDGTHKLVMFRLVVHGCIDGFSRQIIFLHCSTNNEAGTVLQLFLKGVNEYGVPRRVRGDHGGENSYVKDFMEATMGEGRGSFISGPSVHNTRIERFWRDVNEQVSHHFKNVFLFLESQNILYESSIFDIFCLHYVYLPRINDSLAVFKNAWNKHSMRTVHGRTPEQLWLAGMIKEGSDIKLNDCLVDRSYDREHWFEIHVVTFKSVMNENVINNLLNRSVLIVPDPMMDDSNAGVSHYANLRFTLRGEFDWDYSEEM